MRLRHFLFCCALGILSLGASVAVSSAQTTGTTGTTGGTTGTGGGQAVTATSSSSSTGGIGATSGIGNTQGQNGTATPTTSAPIQAIQGSAGSATSIPSNSNPFGSTYVDPLSLGQPSKYTDQVGSPAKYTGTFGTGIYTTTKTTTTTGKASSSTSATGFSTFGTPRAPVYMTALADDFPRVVHTPQKLQGDLQATIARSSFINNKQNIQIIVNGNTVELHGQVSTERERRLVQGMVSMTPGVREVVNQLVVAGKN